MTALYKKSELAFALVCIGIYVALSGGADELSLALGQPKSITFLFHFVFSAVLLLFVKKSGLLKKYGLCQSEHKSGKFLYYIPLAAISSVNLWFGLQMNMPLAETLFYIGSMICVGFLEELLFRGLLFKAMEKDGEKLAVAVSSITFGLGHIVNLFNANSAGVSETVCQIVSAVAIGYLFVTIFRKSGSLIPCIISHSVINSLSAFVNEKAMAGTTNIIVSAVLSVVALGYALVINRRNQKN